MRKDIEIVIKYLESFTGRELHHLDPDFVTRVIDNRISSITAENKKSYIGYLTGNAKEVNHIMSQLLNSFTSFFRDSYTFSILEYFILPCIKIF